MRVGTAAARRPRGQVLVPGQGRQLPARPGRSSFPCFFRKRHSLVAFRARGRLSLARPGPLMAIWVSVFLSSVQPGLR